MQKITVFWFRRDLRIKDNTGLFHALKHRLPILPIFIFDPGILDKLKPDDARVHFIYQTISGLKKQLEELGSSLRIFHESPVSVFRKLINEYQVQAVYANHDYEHYSRERDKKVKDFLNSNGVEFLSWKDHVIFEKDEIVKNDGLPYTVFTPYGRKWKQKFSENRMENFSCENLMGNFYKCRPFIQPKLEELGFRKSAIKIPALSVNKEMIQDYEKTRDYPAVEGTTRLGVHLRFGTISIWELTKIAHQTSEVFLNELIWRNFFIDILWHFPHIVNEPFKKQYDFIEWMNNEKEFELWCRGETGYPLVDAGMRELNQTGFMHNRVRMVAAGFLVKHLLIDWRWGEAYFAEKLLDFELASNNGNWQWAAGTGCDAAPYFRIFNPLTQQQKFDPQNKYILKWVPEVNSKNYPPHVVDHRFARERAIAAYRKALQQN